MTLDWAENVVIWQTFSTWLGATVRSAQIACVITPSQTFTYAHMWRVGMELDPICSIKQNSLCMKTDILVYDTVKKSASYW